MIVIASKRVPSAIALANATGGARINPYRRQLPRRTKLVVNWGTGFPFPDDLPAGVDILNREGPVKTAASKIDAFKAWMAADIPTVPVVFSADAAFEWHTERKTVYARTLTRASGGRGIVRVPPTPRLTFQQFCETVGQTQLFTRYQRADAEFRVHVFHERPIRVTQKLRRRLEEPPEGRFWVRNYQNGWIFARPTCDIGENALDTAVESSMVLGLDFGAVDVLVYHGEPYILEVNTAPGLQGSTLRAYADAFTSYYRSMG